jgi:hypothetical protein
MYTPGSVAFVEGQLHASTKSPQGLTQRTAENRALSKQQIIAGNATFRSISQRAIRHAASKAALYESSSFHVFSRL